MEIESQILNICLIGSTGSGKSSTGNTIFGRSSDEPFPIGHEPVSCTFFADQHVNQEKKIRIIDTPGFGDNRVHEKQVDKIIKDLTLLLTDPRVESSGVIDAFVLPVKFNPRPSTLKTDLEHFIDLFGTVALKTMIILPIFEDQKRRTPQEVVQIFRQFKEIVNILKEGKQEEVNESWFCLWDNIDPKRYPNQERELFYKINLLEKYTHRKFLEAAEEIKRRIDSRVQEEVNRLLVKIKKDYGDNEQVMRQKMKELEEGAEKEKAELKAAVERGRDQTAQFAEVIERLGAQNMEGLKQLFEEMAKEKDRITEQMKILMQDQNEKNEQQMRVLLENQAKLMDSMQGQMRALAQQVANAGSHRPLCSIF